MRLFAPASTNVEEVSPSSANLNGNAPLNSLDSFVAVHTIVALSETTARYVAFNDYPTLHFGRPQTGLLQLSYRHNACDTRLAMRIPFLMAIVIERLASRVRGPFPPSESALYSKCLHQVILACGHVLSRD